MMRLRWWRRLAIGLTVALMAGLGAPGEGVRAAQSTWFETPEVSARLLSAVDAIGPAQDDVRAGLQLRMATGWKVYWRNPGEVGLPPTLTWQSDGNVAASRMSWPAPSRFEAFGIENYGYTDEVVLPLDIKLERPGVPTTLAVDVSLLVCRELCIPVQTDLRLALPEGSDATAGIDAQAAQLIDRYRARVPDDGMVSGLRVVTAAPADETADTLLIHIQSDTALQAPDIFPETSAPVAWGAPSLSRLDERSMVVALPVRDGTIASGESLALTIVDGDRAMTDPAVILATAGSIDVGQALSAPAAGSILPFLALALLGGLILNAMPCVLPVLALKLGTVLDHRDHAPHRVRAGFLVTSLGIVAAMLAIAAGTIMARSAGLAVGWGLQFQNPYFLAFITLIVALFAANLLEMFTIQLPASFNSSLADAGSRQGWFGDFATGAFATLLATPCSAPFLGTAVGFALSGSNTDIALIFTFLGIGLALPYLVVAAFPAAVRLLPRPGMWMNKLRLVMALALLATAMWLLSVLYRVMGPLPSLLLALLILAAIVVAGTPLSRRLLGAGRAAMLAGGLAVLALLTPLAASRSVADAPVVDADWRTFDQAAIAPLIAEGSIVFVDVTADWCLTCKANKALVIDSEPVAGRLASEGVIAMQADWTLPDPVIARYLQSFGRYGIPFNIVYGPAAPQGIVLPELLSTERVMQALDAAGGRG